MICAQTLAAAADGSQSVATTVSQPADLSTCAVVLITGPELSAINGITFPETADFGQAWALGFTLVVSSYVVGWGVGAVLRFVDKVRA